MKMLDIIKVFILLILFSTCGKKESKEEKKTHEVVLENEKYCWQEKLLFEPPDSLPTITLDFLKSDFINKRILKEAVKYMKGTQELNLQLNSGKEIKVIYRLYRYSDGYCGDGELPDLMLNIKDNNITFFDKNNTTFSIKEMNKVRTYISNQENIGQIAIYWEKNSEMIEKVIENILLMYVERYEYIAPKYFGKAICELDTMEVLTLKHTYDCSITLGNLDNTMEFITVSDDELEKLENNNKN